ncbi:Flp family type IVb pilin [Frigidibacter oleivorans]|uniref:Flp family type IVb pilin n=1 Tax=Frigidibacter oleivorans TaxID=2487129 RepID=UPI000F8CA81D|nr:pilus assembly protein [Frigidibacter oleivorans]
MKLFNLVKTFRNDEDGAVTVDWVVLTAAVVGLGIVAMTAIGPAIRTMSGNIASDISTADTIPN